MDDLISKREVLEKYGISYGALYRWKRMGLIPEDWFVKKSAVTGQETFFRRDMICERIETILHLKDTMSLEEMKGQFSKEKSGSFSVQILWQNGGAQFSLNEWKSFCVKTQDGAEIELIDQVKKFVEEKMMIKGETKYDR